MQDAIQGSDGHEVIAGASAEMLLSTLNHDASLLRNYIIKESSSAQGILASLIHGLLHYPVGSARRPLSLHPSHSPPHAARVLWGKARRAAVPVPFSLLTPCASYTGHGAESANRRHCAVPTGFIGNRGFA